MPEPIRPNNNSLQLPVKNIVISAININSITAPDRLEELQQFVKNNDISILALSEIKLDATVHPSLYSLDGFHPPLLRTRSRKGGGVAVYVKNTFPFSQITELENDAFEALWVKIRVQKSTITLCSCYLPPHTSADQKSDFLDYFSDSVADAQKYMPDIITLVGDCNAGNCWLPQNAPYHSPITPFELKLKNTAETLALTQLIKTATRIQSGTHNLRDLAFVDRPDMIIQADVAPPFSKLDHLPLIITLSLKARENFQHPKLTVWDFHNTNIDLITQILSETNWDAIVEKDVDEAVALLTTTILHAADKSIPIKTIRSRNDKPWVSAELRREIRKRDRLFKQAQRRDNERDWTKWRAQRNLVTSLNRKLKNANLKHKVNLLIDSKKALLNTIKF